MSAPMTPERRAYLRSSRLEDFTGRYVRAMQTSKLPWPGYYRKEEKRAQRKGEAA